MFLTSVQGLVASTCQTMPFSAHALKKKNVFFDVNILVKNKSKCGLAWSVLLSTPIHIITVVKICCGLTQLCFLSPQHLATVMTHIIVDKSTDHTKPHSIC